MAKKLNLFTLFLRRKLPKRFEFLFVFIFFFIATFVYLFPIKDGLILLPLDLLIEKYEPWYSPAQILLKNPYMQDSILQLFPWRHFVFQSFTDGQIPFWNPYQFAGGPFMASLKPMVFYPINFLFILGEINAWNATLFAQVFLGMIFAYALGRDFKLNIPASILLGFSFSLSSLLIAFLEFASDGHTLIWWPLLILFAKRFLDGKGRWNLLFLGLAISFCIFAGHLQFFSYMMLTLIAFVIFYGKSSKAKIKHFVLLGTAISLGIGIASIQLLPGLELFLESHRALLDASLKRDVFTHNSILFYQHARLLAPDFFGNPVSGDLAIGYIETSGYIGIIPLFFALFAIFFIRKNKIVVFFTISFLAAFAFSLKQVSEVIYVLKIPVLMSGSAERIFSIGLLSLAVLAGFGFMEYVSSKNAKVKITSIILFAVIFLIIIGLAIFLHHGKVGTTQAFINNVRFPAAIFGIFGLVGIIYAFIQNKTRFAKPVLIIMVLGLTFFDLFRFGYRFLTFSNEKFFYPELPITRFIKEETKSSLGRTFGLTEPELGTYLNIQTVETYNPLYLQRTAVLLQTLQGKKDEKMTADNKYFLTSGGDNLKRTMDFFGVSHIVIAKDKNPSMEYFKTNIFEQDLKEVYRDDKHLVYENLEVLPRFGLYYDYEIIPEDEEILTTIAKQSIDFEKKIILEEKLDAKLIPGTGSATITSYTPNNLEFKITTDENALFYISDAYFPGWKAEVNDIETKIYRSNYNFRSIIVPQGISEVKFYYVPKNFMAYILLSVISFIILVSISAIPDRLLSKYRKVNKKHEY